MKRSSFVALMAFVLFVSSGCGWLLERKADTYNKKVNKLISKFLSENPNIDSNEVVRQDALLKFADVFTKFVDTNGMSDYPMQVVSIRQIDNGYGRGYVVHMVKSKANAKDSISAKTNFDFFAIVDKTTAVSLKQSDKNSYIVEMCSETQYLTSSDLMSVTDDYVYSNLNFIDGQSNLGNWIIHPNRIRPFNGK